MYGVDDPVFGLRFARILVSYVIIFKAYANCVVIFLDSVKFSTIFLSLAVAVARQDSALNVYCVYALFAMF